MKFVNVIFDISRSTYQFESGKSYIYECPENMGLIEGDVVVVDTRFGFNLATVKDFPDAAPTNMNKKEDFKEVVCKVDLTEFNDRKVNAAKRKSLKKQMDDRIKNIQTTKFYEQFAESDPEFKALFDEFNSLNS